MKSVLILHGIQGQAGIHWQKWLHDELVKRNCRVLMPTLPNAMRPDRGEVLEFVWDLCKAVDFSDLVIVGHSMGVTTALDLIASFRREVKGLISVSGVFKDYGAELNSYFLRERFVDLKVVRSLVKKVAVFYGDNDPYVPQDVLKSLADELGVTPVVIPNGGHLNTNAGYTEFPLLLENVLKIS
jgi:hypothetical protein